MHVHAADLISSRSQKALMESRLCVLGSTAIGTETLKNLVLPGCGSITIVDDATITQADLGNNFFVTESDVGSSRAEVSHHAKLQQTHGGTHCACTGYLQMASRDER